MNKQLAEASVGCIMVLVMGIHSLMAQEPPADSESRPEPIPIAKIERETPVDFAREVYPFLKENCISCHNASKAKADLNLETPKSMRLESDSGHTLVPGQPDESLLLTFAAWQEEPVMPPEKNKAGARKLTSQELGLLRLWIKQGAEGESPAEKERPVEWQEVDASLQAVHVVATSADGMLAAAARANRIQVYDLAANGKATELIDPEIKRAHRDFVQSMAFHPDGRLATGGYGGIKIWKPERTEVRHDDLPGAIRCVSPHADGQKLAIGDDQGHVEILPLKGEAKRKKIGEQPIAALAWSGENLVAASGKTIWILNAFSLDEKRKLDLPHNVRAMVGLAEVRLAVTADKEIAVYDLSVKTNAPAFTCKGHTAPVTSLVATDAVLYSGSEDQTVRSWQIGDGKALKSGAHGQPVKHLAMSEDGEQLLSVGSGGATIWKAADLQKVKDCKDSPAYTWRVQQQEIQVTLANNLVEHRKKQRDEASKFIQEAEKKLKEAEEAVKKEEAVRTEKRKPYQEKKKQRDEAATQVQAEADKIPEFVQAETTFQEVETALKKAEEELKKKKSEDLGKMVESLRARRDETRKKLQDVEKQAGELKKKRGELKKLEDEFKKLEIEFDKADQNYKSTVFNRDTSKRILAREREEAKEAEEILKQAEAGRAEQTKKLEVVKAQQKPILFLSGAQVEGRWLLRTDQGVQARSVIGPEPGQNLDLSATGWTPLDARLVTWKDRRVTILAPTRWIIENRIPDLKERVSSLAFSLDGSRLAAASGTPSREGILQVFQVADGQKIWEITDPEQGHEDTVFTLAFSPAGHVLASGSADRSIKLWQAGDGKAIRTFDGHTGFVTSLGWRRDGLRLASGSADKTIKVWNVEEEKQDKTIKDFGHEVTRVSYVGHKDEVLASSLDKTVRIADHRLPEVKAHMYDSAASADGRITIAGGQDGRLLVWTADRKLLFQFSP